ncbi:MAG: LysM domain-containing protein [Anaerolineae bacterium]
MKKNRSTFLGILSLLVVLILSTACYKPAAPEMTATLEGEAEAATPGEELPDIEATAIARSTESAATMEAQAPPEEGEEETTEATATATPEPTTPPTAAEEAPTPTTAPTETQAPVTSGEATHTVRPGENMFRIALRYGTTVDAIARANGIANPRLIYVGQQLTIPLTGDQPAEPSPGGTTYVVRPGDNLFRIALRYNISYLQLAQYNGIANPSNIYVGQVIKIPPR